MTIYKKIYIVIIYEKKEDIYVGYRYFESAAKDKVLYPFGYGLSYTDFSIEEKDFNLELSKYISNITLDNLKKKKIEYEDLAAIIHLQYKLKGINNKNKL